MKNQDFRQHLAIRKEIAGNLALAKAMVALIGRAENDELPFPVPNEKLEQIKIAVNDLFDFIHDVNEGLEVVLADLKN